MKGASGLPTPWFLRQCFAALPSAARARNRIITRALLPTTGPAIPPLPGGEDSGEGGRISPSGQISVRRIASRRDTGTKRQWTGRTQNSARTSAPPNARRILECGCPLPLSPTNLPPTPDIPSSGSLSYAPPNYRKAQRPGFTPYATSPITITLIPLAPRYRHYAACRAPPSGVGSRVQDVPGQQSGQPARMIKL